MLCFASRILYNLDFALQIFWALGTVFEVLLAILVMPTLGWRWLLALSTIPLFIFAFLCFVSLKLSALRYSSICELSKWHLYQLTCMFFGGLWEQWLPESARYDVLTGNQEKALATLKRIATENGAPMPLGKLVAARQVISLFLQNTNMLWTLFMNLLCFCVANLYFICLF